MDEKVENLIAPFRDWNIGELKFERVMSAIDAVVESKIEKLKNEMNAKIQKLQIEKAFPPETTNEGENKDIIEDKYKHTIADILTKNFDLELKTLTGTDTGMNWFVNIPSFINNSFHDYCSALRKKLDAFINSVKNDSSFNTFYNITIRKKDPNYSIYFASTTVLSNPKEFVVHGSLPDDIKITITDCNGNTNDFWFRYYNKNSIIECDANLNFMLFNPVTREYVLFYKSHKFFCVNHDDKNSNSLKTENKDVNDEEVDLEICDEEKKNIEFKHSIADLLIKKFPSELKTLRDTEYYNDVKWFVTLPSYATKTTTDSSSFHDYCRALKRKLDTLINSVNIDSSSNAFYITRQKVDVNTIIPTTILFNPRTCTITRDSPLGYDDIKLTITDCNRDTNILKLKYHRGYSIIECDNNPNFMLFDPINCEYVLFYKSHKLLYASCDTQNVKNEDENVKDKIEIVKTGCVRHYKSKVWGELRHPEDISDQLYHSDKHKNIHNKDLIINNITEKLKTEFSVELDIINGHYTKYCKDYNNIIVPDNYNEFIDIIKQKMGKLIRCTNENFIHIIQKRKLPSGKNAFTFNPKFYSINYKQPNGELSNRFLITLINDDEEMNFGMEYLNNISIIYSENNSNFMIFNQNSNEYLMFYKAETKKAIDKHPNHSYSKITSIAVNDVRKELEKDYVAQLNLLVGKNYDTYKNNYTITIPDSFKHFKHILRQRIKKLIKASSENKIITFGRFKNEDNYNTFCINAVFSYKPKSYSINTDINYRDRYRLILHSKERSNTFNLKYHKDCVIIHGNDSNHNFMIYDPLTNEYTLFVNSETMAEENYLS